MVQMAKLNIDLAQILSCVASIEINTGCGKIQIRYSNKGMVYRVALLVNEKDYRRYEFRKNAIALYSHYSKEIVRVYGCNLDFSLIALGLNYNRELVESHYPKTIER